MVCDIDSVFCFTRVSKLLEAAPKHFLVRKKEQLDLAFERFANSVAAQK